MSHPNHALARPAAGSARPIEGTRAVIETTLVELVLTACEASDDQQEIADWIDTQLGEGDVRPTEVGASRA